MRSKSRALPSTRWRSSMVASWSFEMPSAGRSGSLQRSETLVTAQYRKRRSSPASAR
jgi:hypothetical protein